MEKNSILETTITNPAKQMKIKTFILLVTQRDSFKNAQENSSPLSFFLICIYAL